MDKVSLPSNVNVVFSNAALHWVLDREAALCHFWQLLKPNGGELLIECGGHGNVEGAVRIIFKLMQSNQFKDYFVNWNQSWYFPEADQMERLLKKAKFRDIQINMSKRTMSFSDRDQFALFVKTVIMKPFIGYLPDDMKKEQFLKAFLSENEQSDPALSLDYVRLGIFARK